MRKFLFVLFIVSTHLLTMEQPASTPVVPQVPTYTLIGNDGQQVHIARNLIQQFAPGLAEKFTASGFKEAQTGQIILADLDGHALQHFKELLEQTAALFVIISKQIDEIVKRSEQELEKVPEGQLEQENKLKAEIIAEGFAQSKAITANIVTRIVKIMEELPKIGEHFLNLFNSIVQWRVPYILESAFGKFAVQHLNLVDDENFKQLTDRSFAPRAQLLYLNNLEFNVINCVKAYELLSLLLQNPAATADKQNKELLDTVENTLIQFTVTNIQEILRKQPQFRTFLIRPDAEQIAGILRTQIIEFYAPTFEKKIMDVPLLAELYPIDNKRVMVTQTYSTNDDFIVDLSNGKTVPLKKDNRHVVNYIFWGPNKLIQVCSTRIEEKIRNSIYFYNLDTGAVLDFIDISHQYGIYRVNTIDENRFIFSQKSSDDFFHDNIYLYDLKKPQRNRIQQILKISSFQSDIVALNERQLLICSADPAPDQPPLYIFDLNAHHKTHSWPYRFSNIISIDKAYYWLMFYDSRSYKENYMQLWNSNSLQFGEKHSGISYFPHDTFLDTRYIITFSLEFGRKLIDLRTQEVLKVFPHYGKVLKLDKNHIAALRGVFQSPAPELLLTFIPEVSTLSEILDEIQHNVAPVPMLVEKIEPRTKRTWQAKVTVKQEKKKIKKEEKPK